MFKRIYAITVKEIYHILRDPRSLAIIFAMPAMMVFLFGYALNMDINHIPIGVMDHDNSTESRSLVEAFSASEYFDIKAYPADDLDVENLFRSRAVKAVLVIPDDFKKQRMKAPRSQIQFIVDGSDPTLGNASVNYASAISFYHTMDAAVSAEQLPVEIRERFLYNPELTGANFIIPGIVAIVLMMVCALLTSLTITREKETGTMDVLLVSPVKGPEIIIGKVIPYIGLAFIEAIFILVIAHIVFHIPLNGDLRLLAVLTLLYIFCALGIGLFISSMASTQQVAMMAALVSTILPSMVLSGFIFPIFSMPTIIQKVTNIVPAKHYIFIIRGILMKSVSMEILKGHATALLLLGMFFLVAANARFKARKRK